MPFFDYKCPNCKTIEELMVKRSEDIQYCYKCNTELERQVSSPCFILKGKDWSSSGSFSRAKEGPKLDEEFARLSDVEMNRELGLPDDCA